MSIEEIAKEIADFTSEYGDEYEIMDQMDYGETRDEYIDRLSDEIATTLKNRESSFTIITHLKGLITPETEKTASCLIDKIRNIYNFT